MDIIFHANPALTHQQEHTKWFRDGLKRHGLTLHVTSDVKQAGDIHIVSGPHYAKKYWLCHPRVILIDRELYHPDPPDEWKSMSWVSVGWMRADGGRTFNITGGRFPPAVKDRPTQGGTIFLADFQGRVERADTVRRHPADEKHTEPLDTVLRRHRTAIGYQTSALVTAGLEGLEVICKDQRNIMYEADWLERLPYADWHYTEFQSGALWEHLCHQM